ncbi:proline dehydrogenase 1, mitochondrial [Elysia marginata]|uniref:Proline dehydrogenase n=1 Tax=Elysia marginata TaxID=1093978 RepID=A0AAV4IHG4_9GAST|nr:proline dehydrogenase 1, mitochondrial [Elysia marginata]
MGGFSRGENWGAHHWTETYRSDKHGRIHIFSCLLFLKSKQISSTPTFVQELQKYDIIALTDAEYINMNPGLRLLGLCSMKQCNTGHRARIFYTYQAYLKQTAKELAEDVEFAKASGFTFGVKLVRGAYMVQERQRAREGGYPDPVNDDFEATCRSYATCLDVLLNEVALTRTTSSLALDQSLTSSVRFITASHNEDSVLYAMKRMEELGIPKDGGDVFFGQLYGMADHLSFSLGSMGYYSYKSMPYGALSDTLPYLSRRAQENKAILVNARRERNLILKTLRDRALLRPLRA